MIYNYTFATLISHRYIVHTLRYYIHNKQCGYKLQINQDLSCHSKLAMDIFLIPAVPLLISEYDEMVYWWLADIIQSTEAGDIQFHNGNQTQEADQ